MATVNELMKRPDRSKVFNDIRKETRPSLDASALMARRNDAKKDLDMWSDMLKTAYYYSMPNYNAFENYGAQQNISPGQQYSSEIYDLTLPVDHQKLADKMLMGLAPQGQQWVKFKPGDDFGDEQSDLYIKALRATENMTEQFFKILDRSNFYMALGESLQDVLVSTGFMAINEGNRRNPIIFEAVPASQIMIEGNAMGGIDAVFRDWYKVKISNIKSMWPDANPQVLNKDDDEKVTLYECSYIDKRDEDGDQYKYVVMSDAGKVLLERSQGSWPWVVYRMRKMPGEVRGRGPTMMAYPTAATINEALKDELTAAAFQANPMFMAASDSAFNQETFEAKPGSIIPVQMVMGQWPINAFPSAGNVNFGALVINDLRQQIHELMFASPLGSVDAPTRTATEVSIRQSNNLEAFAAMVPRLQNEFFSPTIQRCLYVINKVLPETFAGIDPAIRERMLSVDGQILSLRYETPLMTERGKIKTNALLSFYQELASMIGPEGATASLNVPDVVTNLAENANVDLSNIKPREEIDKMLKAAGQIATNEAEQQGLIDEQ